MKSLLKKLFLSIVIALPISIYEHLPYARQLWGDDIKAIAVIYSALLRQPGLSRALMISAGARLITFTNPQFDTFFRFSAPRSDLSCHYLQLPAQSQETY